MDRPYAKKPIDILANAAKRLVHDLDMMPFYRPCDVSVLFSRRMTRSMTEKKFFLRHAHHDHDVSAAVHVWNHPEELEFVSVEIPEDVLDLTDEDDIDKYLRKAGRGAIGYVRYRFSFEERVFTVKTELARSLNESFYAIYEERG